MSDNNTQVEILNPASRAHEVVKTLTTINRKVKESFFTTCELLLEAQENGYHTVYDFGNFGEWIRATPELEISERSAYYYIGIAKKAQTLGVTKEQLVKLPITSMKAIFSLDPLEHQSKMIELLDEAEHESVEDVAAKVRKVKAKDGQEEEYHHITLKLPDSIKQTFDDAVELARANYGDVWVNGEPTEAPIARCLEIICISYVQDPNNNPELRELNNEENTNIEIDSPVN